MVYRVNEIFYSIQGEGLNQGLTMVFVRLAGCNLYCDFCDTKSAWETNQISNIKNQISNIKDQYKGNYRTEEILKIVKQLFNRRTGQLTNRQTKRICITGGEPYLQNLKPLVSIFKKHSFWVAIETNGTLYQDLNLDWLTVSPKRKAQQIYPELPKGYQEEFRRCASEFKYVICDKSDFEFIDRKLKQPVILQPVDNDLKIAGLVAEKIKKENRSNWYLGLQLHKIIGER
jgi:organic radical activating enzyme